MHHVILSRNTEKKKTGQIMKENVTLDIQESEIIVRFLKCQDDRGKVATITAEAIWRIVETRPAVLFYDV